MRCVRSGRGDEVPRARLTATVSVRKELPRSRAGQVSGQVACLFGACRHSFLSYIELLFVVLIVLCELVYYSFTVNLVFEFESVKCELRQCEAGEIITDCENCKNCKIVSTVEHKR